MNELTDALKGYETLVGEGGITLSGGQRQRLAIARSIVSQPPILILDEATSSIDVRGEKIVQAALDRVSKDRTTIMIAHRLSTVKRADRIIVMKDGTKIEEGSHQELLAQDGIYRSLVDAQQLGTLSLDSDEQEELPTAQTPDLKLAGSIDLDEKHDVEDQPPEKKRKLGGLKSFLKVGAEQQTSWPLYLLILVAAMAAGCMSISLPNLGVELTIPSGLRTSKLAFCTPCRSLPIHGQEAGRRRQFLGPDVFRPVPGHVRLLLHSWIRHQHHLSGTSYAVIDLRHC